jgi:predicted nucleotidyltransferase component of viral defense system
LLHQQTRWAIVGGVDLDVIRRYVIAALASDDELGEQLVLKGGNALRLVHGIGNRASLDLDYSVETELPQLDKVLSQVERCLTKEFARLHLAPFDVHIEKRPELSASEDVKPTWGGWRLEFKLIESGQFTRFRGDLHKLRNYALALYEGKKSFRIDISKYEYVQPSVVMLFEGYQLRVYPLPMIVYEKLRALCQQMESYAHMTHRTPRPRDFVDIAGILDQHEEEVFRARGMIQPIFAAKEVPLNLLATLRFEYAFHERGWPTVQAEMQNPLPLASYFNRTLSFVDRLEASGIVNPP